MKKLFFYSLLLWTGYSAKAQPAKEPSSEYRESATRINDLVHTKLDVKFDYSKSWMYGKAWITLKPHFYPTDSLTLDAKGMDIQKVAHRKRDRQSTLKYDYDGLKLNIKLDKTYKARRKYTIISTIPPSPMN